MLIFNFSEKRDIENMIKKGYINEDNYPETIRKLATYNFHMLNLEKEDNYDEIKKYMNKYAKDFFEPEYMNIIYDKIRMVKKIPIVDIDHIGITKSELDKISKLNDIRKEKIAFVLLAVAKFNDVKLQRTDHRVNLSNSKICKLARITMRISERDSFMKFLIDDGVIEVSTNPKSNSKKVLIVSEDDNDEVVLKLHEVDYEELAYNYLMYKNDGDGYVRCEYIDRDGNGCNRVFKLNSKNKNGNIKYCHMHREYQPVGNKIITCVDCGKEFIVGALNTETCRCEVCNEVYQKKRNAEKNRAYRERLKNKS